MTFPHRRQFLHLAAALPAFSRIVRAQAYPSRPITLVVPFAAGGGADTVLRIITERMRTLLGQTILLKTWGVRAAPSVLVGSSALLPMVTHSAPATGAPTSPTVPSTRFHTMS